MNSSTRHVKRTIVWIVCAALIFVAVRITKISRYAPGEGRGNELVGVMHVHSIHSDGGESFAAIAEKAARAGLDFVVMTDHGNPSRPDEPAPADPVFIVGSEVTTDAGHLLAVGDSVPTYNYSPEPIEAVRDVASQGGFSVIAHPMNERIPWTEWPPPPADGMEVINADSEWRETTRATLARTLPLYWLNPVYFHLRLLHYPRAPLRAFDHEASLRRILLFAGLDAHNNIRLSPEKSLHFPDYLPLFRTLRLRIPGGVARTRENIVEALRRGAFYVSLDGLASGSGFDFTATVSGRTYRMGDVVDAGTISLRVVSPKGSRLRLLHNGREIAASSSGSLTADVSMPGAYRAEAYRLDQPFDPELPWILSNPIFLGKRYLERPQLPAARVATALERGVPVAPDRFRVENDPLSDGEYDGARLRFRIGKTADPRVSPFVALSLRHQPALTPSARFLLVTRSDRTYRFWLEVRTAARSYRASVKSTPELAGSVVELHGMRPLAREPGYPAPPVGTSEIYIVFDRDAVPKGTSGELWLQSFSVDGWEQ